MACLIGYWIQRRKRYAGHASENAEPQELSTNETGNWGTEQPGGRLGKDR